MKTILVTGGAGFIGSTLIPILIEQGYQVRVLDNLSVGTKAALDGNPVEFLVGDIRDRATVRSAAEGMDGIVHLAAHTSVIDSQSKPWEDMEINVGGTLNLLIAARDQGVPRFVMASSNAPVGECIPPIDESKPARPLSPYGASKLAGEGYCSAFHGSFGVGTVVLRFANVYGPKSVHKGSVVAKFIREAKAQGALTIYGDGMQTRDFIYSEDLCRAIVAALQSNRGGETYQIATGIETRIIDLAKMVQRSLPAHNISIMHEGQRAGEIIKNYSSIGKAKRELGWSPTVPLAEGLQSTLNWFATQDSMLSPMINEL